MSKVDNFLNNIFAATLGNEIAQRANRDLLKDATDEELEKMAKGSCGIYDLDTLKQARASFQEALRWELEN